MNIGSKTLIFLAFFVFQGLNALGQLPTHNLARDKKAFAFSTERSSYSVGKITDGNRTAYSGKWVSEKCSPETPQWVFIDLGKEMPFDRVWLFWDEANAVDYQVEVSSDTIQWHTVYRETNSEGGKKRIRIGKQHSRYIRLLATRSNLEVSTNVSLAEFEVYNGKPPVRLEDIADQPVITIRLTGGASTIILPAVPHGYKLKLVNTDCLQVINQNGKIHLPTSDVKVHLYCTLTEKKTGRTIDGPGISVIVPGVSRLVAGNNPKPLVIPSLREWQGLAGHFKLSSTTRVVVDSSFKTQLEDVANCFASDFRKFTGKKIEVVLGNPGKGDFYFTLDSKEKQLGNEGYSMGIEDVVTLSSPEPLGLFRGTRTILQLLRLNPEMNIIPKGRIRDYPKYEHRGFMIDAGRKFISYRFLCDYVKIMSYYKMNELQVHLNDNGNKAFFGDDYQKTYAAFRLESTTFPELTAKDGFYTKKQFNDLQKLGMLYGVNVIPEIDAPAHALAFTHYMPEIASKKYGPTYLDIDNPKTFEFMDKLYTEYCGGKNPVFIGKDVHIGTDEYSKEENERFRYFTDHYIKYVEQFGKHVRLWGALTHAPGKTPVKSEGVTMNVWYNGYADPREMIKQGYEIISTPDRYLYIVPAAGYYYDYLNTKYLYNNWEPVNVGGEWFPFGYPQITGGMFCEWNDRVGNGISEKDIHDRVMPAMQVLSEKMWTGTTDDRDFEKFEEVAGVLGEAPGVNIAGKVPSRTSEVVSYQFDYNLEDTSSNKYDAIKDSTVIYFSDQSGNAKALFGPGTFIRTPIKEIGYDYTVSFELKIDKQCPVGAILFQSPNAKVLLNEVQPGELSFLRDGYDYRFDYEFPLDVPVNIAIQGDNKGTTLFVNGEKKQALVGSKIYAADGKRTTKCIQTLVFPLRYIGSKTHSFIGWMDNLKVYNRKLSEEEIRELY